MCNNLSDVYGLLRGGLGTGESTTLSFESKSIKLSNVCGWQLTRKRWQGISDLRLYKATGLVSYMHSVKCESLVFSLRK